MSRGGKLPPGNLGTLHGRCCMKVFAAIRSGADEHFQVTGRVNSRCG